MVVLVKRDFVQCPCHLSKPNYSVMFSRNMLIIGLPAFQKESLKRMEKRQNWGTEE